MAAFAPGTRSEAVRAYQQHLLAMGFDPGPIDGIYGPRTQAAEAAFNAAGAPGMLRPAGPAPVLGPTPPAQTDANRSARAIIESGLAQYGLQSLGDQMWNNYLNGMPIEQVMLEIRKTPEYRQRFPGMDQLSSQGRAISEGEYIALERQYAQIAHQAGLPSGFYDSPDDFSQLITGNTSPVEYKQRLDTYAQAMYMAPQEDLEALRRMYGVDDGHLLAFFIDPATATPLIQKKWQSAQVAGFTERAGLDRLTTGQAETLAELSPQELNQRIALYQAAAYGQPEETKRELARLYGITDLTDAIVDTDTAVGLLQERVQAAITAGMSTRTGFGSLSAREAERLAAVGVTEETFQQLTHDQPLFTALPGLPEQAINRGKQIDIAAGDQQSIDELERKRALRKAQFGGGGGFAQSNKGVAGLGTYQG